MIPSLEGNVVESRNDWLFPGQNFFPGKGPEKKPDDVETFQWLPGPTRSGEDNPAAVLRVLSFPRALCSPSRGDVGKHEIGRQSFASRKLWFIWSYFEIICKVSTSLLFVVATLPGPPHPMRAARPMMVQGLPSDRPGSIRLACRCSTPAKFESRFRYWRLPFRPSRNEYRHRW